MVLSAIAAGSACEGTCSLTDACHAGPNKAIPVPIIKQKVRRLIGVTKPRWARIDRAVAPARATDRAASPTIRRSYMSAIAPAASDVRSEEHTSELQSHS